MAIDFHNRSMFKEFFSDAIILKGVRTDGSFVETTVPALVFAEEDAEPVDELSLDSTVKSITAIFDDETWKYYNTRIHVGDKIRYNNRSYEVREVEYDSINGWQIKAREVR